MSHWKIRLGKPAISPPTVSVCWTQTEASVLWVDIHSSQWERQMSRYRSRCNSRPIAFTFLSPAFYFVYQQSRYRMGWRPTEGCNWGSWPAAEGLEFVTFLPKIPRPYPHDHRPSAYFWQEANNFFDRRWSSGSYRSASHFGDGRQLAVIQQITATGLLKHIVLCHSKF